MYEVTPNTIYLAVNGVAHYDRSEMFKLCKKFRQIKLKLTQKQVANILGYSVENIAAFEQGRTRNCEIYDFYVRKGFNEWREENGY